LPFTAAVLRAGEVEVVAKHRQQRLRGCDVDLMRRAVDPERDLQEITKSPTILLLCHAVILSSVGLFNCRRVGVRRGRRRLRDLMLHRRQMPHVDDDGVKIFFGQFA
jgi:hypothetical protein